MAFDMMLEPRHGMLSLETQLYVHIWHCRSACPAQSHNNAANARYCEATSMYVNIWQGLIEYSCHFERFWMTTMNKLQATQTAAAMVHQGCTTCKCQNVSRKPAGVCNGLCLISVVSTRTRLQCTVTFHKLQLRLHIITMHHDPEIVLQSLAAVKIVISASTSFFLLLTQDYVLPF